MTMASAFRPDQGQQLSQNGISILLHMLAQSRPGWSGDQQRQFFRCIGEYLEAIGAYDSETLSSLPAIDTKSFPQEPDREFFKFVDDELLQHYVKGSFQLSSIQHYRDIEKQNSKDQREGLANLIIATPNKRIFISLVSGFNFGIFCGTRHLANKEKMHSKFGRHILKIRSTQRFADALAGAFSAKNYYIHRVRYADLKLFRTRTLRRFDLTRPGAPTIDERIFEFIRTKSFFPSVFMKPSRFEDETELRIAFEFPKDFPRYDRRHDESLLKHIEVVT